MRAAPSDPIIAELVRRARTAQFSRRRLLQGLGLGAAALGAASLTACAPSGPKYGDGSGGNLRWASWTYYLDFDEETGDFPTLNEFMAESNISVEYFEDVDDNKMFMAKVKDQLKLGQDTGYDLFTLTDSSLIRLWEQEQLKAFDHGLIPNADAQMIDLVRHSSFDPAREWSIPYQAGMTGLVYNSKLYPKGVQSVSDLWNPDLKGKVSLLSEQDDTLGLIMLEQGVDITGDGWGDDEFFAALAVAEEHIKNGDVYTVKGNSYTQDLQSGAVVAGMAWSGDVAMINEEEGEEVWKFVVPEAGATLFIDSFCLPESTAAYEESHALIDYYYEPEVAARVAEYVQYVTPVAGARDAMATLNPEMAENPLVFPDEEMSARIHDMRTPTAQEDNRYAQAYQKILGN
ncbi:spermidine/putrescine transport system substrate-binding protein [Leucobacter komagatae]|uniref:Spermidine/putrescine transport system substrate-binding protein n=1 Tax=Leucobacter komagatae TaxID=55969 RepID=A0A542Y580_9MICO|nr:spermidine/putrescine ABC transporter substrate-binding protein [Leucobacter komagatae]TQL43229.1 spermidine/putrescine transport system substrate-binding protein [Leucobacter komagatae]